MREMRASLLVSKRRKIKKNHRVKIFKAQLKSKVIYI